MRQTNLARAALAFTLAAPLFACGGVDDSAAAESDADAITIVPLPITRIAYQKGSDIHSIGADGSGDVTLTAGSRPSYSQGRTRMAYAINGAIKVVDAPFDAAAFAAAFTVYSGQGTWAGVSPSISADGNKVVFASAGLAGSGATLFVYTMGTNNPVTLVSGANTWVFDPTFTNATGTHVAYTTGTPSVVNGLSIRRVSASSVNVPAASGTLLVGGGYRPAFSIDGTQLAFYRWVNGSGYDIFLANADGSGVASWVGNSDQDDTDPSFSPSGASLAFISKRSYVNCSGLLCVFGNTAHTGENLWRASLSASTVDNLSSNSSASINFATPSWR